MKEILVVVDFSDVTNTVVETAINYAKNYGLELCFLHVEGPEPDFMGYDEDPDWMRTAVAMTMKRDHHELQAIEKKSKEANVPCKTLLIQGPTVEKILDISKKIETDLIVMGTHGHGALYNAMMGSVSTGVVHKTDIPVLLIPSRKNAQ